MHGGGRQLAAPHQIVNLVGCGAKQIDSTCDRASARSDGSSNWSAGSETQEASPRPIPSWVRRAGNMAPKPAGCPARRRRSPSGWRPARIRSLPPRARGSSGEPGTANTSRPSSWAMRAVIRLPERRAASTTTTPSDRPAMMRLRRGKCRACGAVPSGGFGDHGASFGDPALQIGIFRRVGQVEPAGDRRRRCGRCAWRAGMRGRVDAARQAGHHGHGARPGPRPGSPPCAGRWPRRCGRRPWRRPGWRAARRRPAPRSTGGASSSCASSGG